MVAGVCDAWRSPEGSALTPQYSLTDLRRVALRSRGVGAVDACPSLQQLQGISDPTDPCQSTVTQTANIGGTCFLPLFPFVGNRITGGGSPAVCSPVFTVPSPWALVITVGLGGLVAWKLLGGRR